MRAFRLGKQDAVFFLVGQRAHVKRDIRSALLDSPPYAARAELEFRAELLTLTEHHLDGCPEYRAAWPGWRPTDDITGFPFLHVGAFKSIRFVTKGVGLSATGLVIAKTG